MEDSKEKQNDTASPNEKTGTNPENKTPKNDDVTPDGIPLALLQDVVSPTQQRDFEEVESSLMTLDSLEDAIKAKKAALASSGKVVGSKKADKLSPLQKTHIRAEIRGLNSSRKQIKQRIAELSHSVSSVHRLVAQRERRVSLRRTTSKSSYHTQHGVAVKTAIKKFVAGMDPLAIAALKAKLAKPGPKGADYVLLHSLLKAPRNLFTRVAANEDARVDYLQHFRSELGATKKTTKKRGRSKK